MTANADPGAPSTGAPDHCYRHPNRETWIHCTRCDRPICPECMRPASVGFHCPDDVREGNKSIRRARTAAGAVVTGRPPYVTWSIIALCVIVYIQTGRTSTAGFDEPGASRLFVDWLLQPQQIASHHQYYRLITAAFVHENLLHIASNMIALYFIGPHLERLLGTVRYLAVYLLALIGGSAAVYILGDRFTETVGASGAIFGLFAACLLFVRELGFDRRALIVTIAINFVFTFSVPDISKLDHVGGFAVGGLASFAIAGLPWERRRLSPAVQAGWLSAIGVVLVLAVLWRTSALT